MDKLFGKKKTVEQQMRENERQMRRQTRGMERDRAGLEKETVIFVCCKNFTPSGYRVIFEMKNFIIRSYPKTSEVKLLGF